MRIITKLIAAIFCIALLSGCGPIHAYRPQFNQGNVITAAQVNQLKPGMSQEQVLVILGTPVYINTFDPNTWVYIDTLQLAAKVLEYNRVDVHFRHGVVSNVDVVAAPRK